MKVHLVRSFVDPEAGGFVLQGHLQVDYASHGDGAEVTAKADGVELISRRRMGGGDVGGTGGDVPGSKGGDVTGSKGGDVTAMGGDVSTSPRTGGDVRASRPTSPTSPAKFNRFHFDHYSS